MLSDSGKFNLSEKYRNIEDFYQNRYNHDMQYRMSTRKYCLFLYSKIPLHAVETKDGRDCYG